MATEYFEDVIVGYTLRTARMPFFITGFYPHYKIENGRLVADNGPESRDLRQQAVAFRDLVKRVENRVEQGLRVPKTWIRQLDEASTLVIALREEKCIIQEWADEFHRMVRYLKARTV